MGMDEKLSRIIPTLYKRGFNKIGGRSLECSS